jgi:hypothetical protein
MMNSEATSPLRTRGGKRPKPVCHQLHIDPRQVIHLPCDEFRPQDLAACAISPDGCAETWKTTAPTTHSRSCSKRWPPGRRVRSTLQVPHSTSGTPPTYSGGGSVDLCRASQRCGVHNAATTAVLLLGREASSTSPIRFFFGSQAGFEPDVANRSSRHLPRQHSASRWPVASTNSTKDDGPSTTPSDTPRLRRKRSRSRVGFGADERTACLDHADRKQVGRNWLALRGPRHRSKIRQWCHRHEEHPRPEPSNLGHTSAAGGAAARLNSAGVRL